MVEPKLGEPEPLGKRADADLLEPRRRKAEADGAPGAGEDETGTSSPEKLTVGMSAMQVVPNTAATCVRTKVDIKRPNPVAAHTQSRPPAMSAAQEP